MNEISAGQKLQSVLAMCVLKMVKMQEAPTPKELTKQL
jgi:hypothetical protein